MPSDDPGLQLVSTTILDVVQTAAIVIALLITFLQLRRTLRSDRTVTSFHIIGSHRDVWAHLFTSSALERILEENVDVEAAPPNALERFFVIMVINHMTAVYEAHLQGLYKIHRSDIKAFFNLPIPRHVWHEIREHHHAKFVCFVDKLIES